MTLESWSMGIVRPVMQVYPAAWAFFVPFIIITTFTMLNLFIAFLVTATQNQQQAEEKQQQEALAPPLGIEPDPLTAQVTLLRQELADLRKHLEIARLKKD
jgi:voltage-gated sodium channel